MKKIILLLSFFLFLVNIGFSQECEDSNYNATGDVNLNGTFNVLDIVAMVDIILN